MFTFRKWQKVIHFRHFLCTYGSVDMGTFVQKKNPVTGRQEWVMESENYDYLQEIARSAYADMLHDTERNKKYDSALKQAIELMHKKGKSADVLDIGTGTGLLSMMAVRSGADTVTACEAFTPMATCAKKVIQDNNCSDKIRLIPKRSNKVIVGPDGDMPSRANILVTEVFDTELIGEGAISTFNHAHESLLQEDSIVVPSAANMYIQVVHSKVARNWSRFQPIKVPNCDDIVPPTDITTCPGSISVHDLQMEQISKDWFTPITEPCKVFRFDFTGQKPMEFNRSVANELQAIANGRCDAIFMWWDLQMDTKGDIMLSCAPSWAEPEELQWRDHWMQAVYYPRRQIEVEKGESFTLHSCHDEYSLWFDVAKQSVDGYTPDPPACHCGAHIGCGWTRLGLMNDEDHTNKYIDALRQVVSSDTICLSISDGSMLPFIAARLGVKKVYTLESQPIMRQLTEKYIQQNNLKDTVQIITKGPEELTQQDFDGHKIDLIIGEPYFLSTTLPWHNLLYWYCRTEVEDLTTDQPTVLPRLACIRAIAVNFTDLWKIRAPVGQCEGFNLEHFDKMIEAASGQSDAYLEPQPLWEYPGVPLTDQFEILTLDFSRPLTAIKTVEREGFIELWSSGCANGVAVWIDYHLDRYNTIQSGLTSCPQEGQPLQWDIHTRQAVHIFPNPVTVPSGECHKWRLKHKVVFKPKTGDLDFKFEVIQRSKDEIS